jgi:hypothetical protein
VRGWCVCVCARAVVCVCVCGRRHVSALKRVQQGPSQAYTPQAHSGAVSRTQRHPLPPPPPTHTHIHTHTHAPVHQPQQAPDGAVGRLVLRQLGRVLVAPQRKVLHLLCVELAAGGSSLSSKRRLHANRSVCGHPPPPSPRAPSFRHHKHATTGANQEEAAAWCRAPPLPRCARRCTATRRRP